MEGVWVLSVIGKIDSLQADDMGIFSFVYRQYEHIIGVLLVTFNDPSKGTSPNDLATPRIYQQTWFSQIKYSLQVTTTLDLLCQIS